MGEAGGELNIDVATRRRDRSRSRRLVDSDASGGITTGVGSSDEYPLTVEERRLGHITPTPAISASLSVPTSSQRRAADPRPSWGTLPGRDWSGGSLHRNEDCASQLSSNAYEKCENVPSWR